VVTIPYSAGRHYESSKWLSFTSTYFTCVYTSSIAFTHLLLFDIKCDCKILISDREKVGRDAAANVISRFINISWSNINWSPKKYS